VALVLLLLLEAEAADFRTAAVALLLVAEREVLPPPLSSVSFPFRFLPFLLLLWFSSPPFSFLSVLSFPLPFLSLSVFSFSSTLLCFSRLFSSSSLLFSPSLLLCWLLFIEPSEWLFAVEHGEQPVGRPLGATAKARPPPPRFSGRCAVGGRPLCPVGGLQAREWPAKNSKKRHPFSFFPAACLGGKKKDEQCRSKRHRSALFFF